LFFVEALLQEMRLCVRCACTFSNSKSA